MSLGLGEIAPPVEGPSEAFSAAPATEGAQESAPASPEVLGQVEQLGEPDRESAPADTLQWIEESPSSAPVAGPADSEPEGPEEYLAIELEGTDEQSEREMDFSGLIESLDVDDDLPVRDSAGVTPAGFDDEILRDEQPQSGDGVISTEPFLSDISMSDLSFSGGLTDELSALTGAERRGGHARPQASVNPLPDEKSGGLHRDTRVDRETLLKIIDGIERL
jgi:hypothetical protein